MLPVCPSVPDQCPVPNCNKSTPGSWFWAPAGCSPIPGAIVRPALLRSPPDPRLLGLVSPQPSGWRRGYWGLHMGFHGGINYGLGFAATVITTGTGAETTFYYNRSVNRVNVNIPQLYNRTVVVNNNLHITYNSRLTTS